MSSWCKRLRRWCKRRSRWNPRTRDPPPSTGKNPETRTYDQTCFPTNESNVPLIDLTHAFDTKVTKVMKKLLVKRKQCRVCGWEGTSEDFCLSHGKAKREELQEQASRCISCRTRLLIMEEITRLEGLVPEATDTLETHVLGSRVDFIWLLPRGLESESRCYDIFMPSEACHSNFDEISTFSRRNISWDATMKDSLKQSIQWARGHITECENQHDQCDIRNDINLDDSTGGTSVNPSRLIDVNPDGMPGLDVKLRDQTSLPSGKPLEYAALSYSWGTYKPDKLRIFIVCGRDLERPDLKPNCLFPNGFSSLRNAISVSTAQGNATQLTTILRRFCCYQEGISVSADVVEPRVRHGWSMSKDSRARCA
ncbi:hypothetical protein HDK64DRAFT_252905 [Phyllosticta capitalensis]